MSLASHQCKGCSRFFTPTGLNSHVRQTPNDNCRRWYHEHSSLPQVDKQDNDEPPQDFEGDLYDNNYQEQDFPGFDDARHVLALGSDDEDDEDDTMVYDENGW
jgi:hypothetical protein